MIRSIDDMRFRTFAMPCLALGLIVGATGAQAEPTRVWTCYQNAHYLVVERPATGQDPSAVLMRSVTNDRPADCTPDPRPGDVDLNPTQEVGTRMVALQGRHVVLDSSTGPTDLLRIVNLKTRNTVVSELTHMCDPIWLSCLDNRITPEGMVFWRRTGEQATRETCPDFDRVAQTGTPLIELQSIFYFRSETLISLGVTRCVSDQ